MPIPYTDIRRLIDDVDFQKRLQVAIWREASVQLRKTPAAPDAVITWSREQLKGPSQRMVEATIRVATVGAVYNQGAAVSDADLQTVVGNIMLDLAGG